MISIKILVWYSRGDLRGTVRCRRVIMGDLCSHPARFGSFGASKASVSGAGRVLVPLRYPGDWPPLGGPLQRPRGHDLRPTRS